MTRKIFLILLVVFLCGVAGGLWAQAFLLPYLAGHSAFQNAQFIQDWNARTQVIAPLREVVITESQRTEELMQRTQLMVGLVTAANQEGSGLIVTSDGLLITLVKLVPPGFKVQVTDPQGKIHSAQVLKRSGTLALLKIEEENLQTAGFTNDVQLGNPVVLVARTSSGVLANQGIVTSITEDAITTNILEKAAQGSPLVNHKGRIVGLVQVDRTGRVIAIPAATLQTFLGL